MAEDPPGASQRYIDLVSELAEQLKHRRGWKSEVARRLGVHPSFVSRIAEGKVQSIGVDIIERAMERLGLPRSFFFEPDFGSPAEAAVRMSELALRERARAPAPGLDAAAPFGSAKDDRHRKRLRELQARFEELAGKGALDAVDAAFANELADLILNTDAVQAALMLRGASTQGQRIGGTLWLFEALRGWL